MAKLRGPLGTHRLTKTRAYGAWANMLYRCRNPNYKAYADYGGRGINVCERWHSFENFLEDMGQPPPGLSLDRIDNDGGYAPDNCRWADRKTQMENRRPVRWLTHNGETATMAEWARRSGISKSALFERLRRGWAVSDALGRAPDHRRVRRNRPTSAPTPRTV